MFEDLFLETPDDESLVDSINKESLVEFKNSRVESSLIDSVNEGTKRFQFIRNGYFVVDEKSDADNLVFNRIVALKGNYKKMM